MPLPSLFPYGNRATTLFLISNRAPSMPFPLLRDASEHNLKGTKVSACALSIHLETISKHPKTDLNLKKIHHENEGLGVSSYLVLTDQSEMAWSSWNIRHKIILFAKYSLKHNCKIIMVRNSYYFPFLYINFFLLKNN